MHAIENWRNKILFSWERSRTATTLANNLWMIFESSPFLAAFIIVIKTFPCEIAPSIPLRPSTSMQQSDIWSSCINQAPRRILTLKPLPFFPIQIHKCQLSKQPLFCIAKHYTFAAFKSYFISHILYNLLDPSISSRPYENFKVFLRDVIKAFIVIPVVYTAVVYYN